VKPPKALRADFQQYEDQNCIHAFARWKGNKKALRKMGGYFPQQTQMKPALNVIPKYPNPPREEYEIFGVLVIVLYSTKTQ
jgi:hypothetical protein